MFPDMFLSSIVKSRADRPITFANVRFDLKEPEQVEFHSDLDSWISSVDSHLPSRSLGFSDNSAGSDILQVIDRFLNTDQAPLCGAIINIALKRYPNETDITNLVNKIRKHHAVVTVVIPTNSSGGNHPETMYNLATKTNGLAFFATDSEYGMVSGVVNKLDYQPYLYYSANVKVFGTASVPLPNLSLAMYVGLQLQMTLQDSGPISNFRNVSLTVANSMHSLSWTPSSQNTIISNNSNFMDNYGYLDAGNYAVSLQYEYSDSREQTLQIRMFSRTLIDYWIPYAN